MREAREASDPRNGQLSPFESMSEHAHTPIDRRHPLIGRELETDGLNLFVEQYRQLTNISRAGQTAMREIIKAALRRIDRDLNGIPIKLYPYPRQGTRDAPAMVVIDPALSAGRPVIAGTGLATQIIAERYKLGESIGDLAYDYERPNEEIEEAIRYIGTERSSKSGRSDFEATRLFRPPPPGARPYHRSAGAPSTRAGVPSPRR